MIYGALSFVPPPLLLLGYGQRLTGRSRRRKIFGAAAVQVRAKLDGGQSGTVAAAAAAAAGERLKQPLLDVNDWGVGSAPIFTIVASSDGGRLNVSVDEEEIIVRCGFQSMVSNQPFVASERILRARQIAQEIEQGLLVAPEASSLFKFVKEEEEEAELLNDLQLNAVAEATISDGLQVNASPEAASQVTTVSDGSSGFGVEDARPFLIAGLVAGLAMAVTSCISSFKRRSSEPVRATLQTKNLALIDEETTPVVAAADDEERIAKIRGMAHQVQVKEETRQADKEGVPLPLQYAAVAGAELVRKQNSAREADKQKEAPRSAVSLAQQLDEVRRSGEDEALSDVFLKKTSDPPEVSQSPSNGNSRFMINGHSKVAKNVTKNDAQVSAGGQQRVMPRIITSYKEACEVLSSRKLRDRKKLEDDDTKSVAKADQPKRVEPKLGADSRTDQPSMNEQITAATEHHVWKQDGLLRDILIKARENDRMGRKLFHGMRPEAKDILFEGLEKELGGEAEPIKAWIMEKTDAAQSNGVSLSTSLQKRADHVQSKPQKTVLTSSGGNLKPKESSTDQRFAKANKKKVWPKELQRRYDSETDPKMRRLMKEIGKDLDEWISEEKVEESLRLFNQGTEGRQELLRRWHAELKEEARKKGAAIGDDVGNVSRYAKMEERIRKQAAMFGPQGLASKFQDYKPRKPDTLWWLDLRYVACILLQNDEQKMAPGLYSLNMALDSEKETMMHVVGFEDQKEALNFCRILVPELDKLGGSTGAGIVPFEPKELLDEAKSGGYKVTVLKKGQVELYAGKALEEVESRMVEIGKDVYVQERMRERSIDIKAVMEELGRDL